MRKTIWAYFVEKYFRPLTAAITEKINGKNAEEKLLHKTMLREEYSPDLKWDSTTLNQSVVAADVVSLDSSLPLKLRGVVATASGEIAKLGMKFMKRESDINRINIMIARDTKESEIAKKIFDDTSKVIKGIDIRNEIMFQQGLSTGITLVTGEENTGTGVRVSFGYRSANTFHATTAKWDDTSATPIDDIRQLFDKADRDGNSIGHVYLSKKYFNLARRTEQVKQFTANYAGQIIVDKSLLVVPTQKVLLDALADEFGAQFHVIDSSFLVETPDGKHQVVKPWEQANVIGTPSNIVGRLVYGTLAEETNPVENVKYAKSGSFILVSKYSKTDPLREFTASQALCLPVIDGADAIYILHADATEKSELSVDPTELTFAAKSATKTAAIHFDGDFSGLTVTSSDADWLTAKIRSDKKVAITVAANAATTVTETDEETQEEVEKTVAAEERTGTVTVTDGETSAVITVTQKA